LELARQLLDAEEESTDESPLTDDSAEGSEPADDKADGYENESQIWAIENHVPRTVVAKPDGSTSPFLQVNGERDAEILRPGSAQSARSLDELIARLDLRGHSSRRNSVISPIPEASHDEDSAHEVEREHGPFKGSGHTDDGHGARGLRKTRESSNTTGYGNRASASEHDLLASRVIYGRHPVSVITPTPHMSEHGHLDHSPEIIEEPATALPKLTVHPPVISDQDSNRDGNVLIRPEHERMFFEAITGRKLSIQQADDLSTYLRSAMGQFPSPPPMDENTAFWPSGQPDSNGVEEDGATGYFSLKPRNLGPVGLSTLGYGWDGPKSEA